MHPISEAPKDGSRIVLFRKSGEHRIGRWAQKADSYTHEFGWRTYTEVWIDDNEKFIDIPLDPVMGWEPV